MKSTNPKPNLLFIFLFFCFTLFSQESTQFYKALKVDVGVFIFDTKWIQSRPSFLNLTDHFGISKKIAQQWDLGITSILLVQLPKSQSYLFSALDRFYIAGPFARYYFGNFSLNPYWEGSLEYGNLCNCYFNSTFGEFHILNNAFYLGNNLGLEKRIASNVFVKVNLKGYYLLNSVENKKLFIRPFINFNFRLNKKPKHYPPLIYNPRL